MSFSLVLNDNRKETTRHTKAFAERAPALAAYATADDILAALGRCDDAPAALLGEVIIAAQRPGASPLWQAILVAAFEPMLRRLRRRFGQPSNDDLDSAVLLAFLGAVRTIRPDAHAAYGLRLATQRTMFTAARKERGPGPAVELDEEGHALVALGVNPHDTAKAAEVVRMIESDGGDELLDVLLATRAGDESLHDYVARNYPSSTTHERGCEYERLCRARLELEKRIRNRVEELERVIAA